MARSWGLALAIALLGASTESRAADSPFQQGDHVSLVGNVLAERMQHDGWLEAYLQCRLPDHHFSIRNLGFSGDEVVTRLRSENFGTPDQWLERTKADVVIAFFGFNESFAGEKGLAKFRADLDAYARHITETNFSGRGNARLILCSPTAFEDRHDANLPDGKAINPQLEAYTKVIAEVAQAHKLPFVDLFHPTLARSGQNRPAITTNGHYLNSDGNALAARLIDQALFPDARPLDPERLEKVRQAAIDKDFYFFNRYRTTDGYNVYGGRSSLKYTDDISNRVVMDREMEILDVQAANRDQRVWALARGSDLKVDDSNTPPFIPVKTNLPGPLEGGKHVFLSGEDAIAKMTVADGLAVNLFASEEQFPELISPVQMSFDAKGRLWVATWPTYPHWTPKDPQNDRLIVLEDTNGDGKADKCTTFADDLSCPTGFEFWNGGVLVAMAPDLLFLKDTDGDGKADYRERVLHGLDSADSHHTANSFVLAPDGALYFQEGTFHQSQIETVDGVHRNNNACVWRFEPRTRKVERYIPFDFANPHGHAVDRWGQQFVHDGTGAQPYHATLFSGFLPYPKKHGRPPQLYQQRTRPCPGTEILSSRHFPEKYQGNLLVGNVIGFQGILQYRFEDRDSSFAGIEVEPIISSTDRNFRPADLEIGPDGALYFTDWQNPIIGHMQHHIRDPNRNKVHGRVYRITAKGRDLLQPPTIAGASIPDLLNLLKSPEDRVRFRTRIELSGRKSSDVVAEARKWASSLETADPQYEHNLLEALWVCQQHNVVDEALLNRVLTARDFRARAAGVQVLCGWRDRVPDFLDQLKKLARDESPRVRLEAVRAASFSTDPAAAEVALSTLELPTDAYLDFTRQETLKALDSLPPK